MWFALGLVTLAGAAVASGYRRLHPGVPGEQRGGYTCHVSRDKHGKIVRVRVAVPARSDLEFECKPESDFDRFCKKLGIANEQQLGQHPFDDAVYLISDDPRVGRELKGDQPLVEDILLLFRQPVPVAFPLAKLRCRDGFLVAEFKRVGDVKDATSHMDAVAPVLQRIAAALPPRLGSTGRRDPLFLRSAIVLGASTGLALNGSVQLLRSTFGFLPITVDLAKLFVTSLVPALLLVLGLALLAIRLLGRSSRLHLVLLEIFLAGSFGALATCYVELRDANMEFDTSPAMRLPVEVVSKYVSHGRNSTHYHLVLTDWNGSSQTKEIEVSSSEYDATPVGQPMTVIQYRGWLGIRWVENVYPVADDSAATSN